MRVYHEKLCQYRRDFHRYPETAWMEYRTSAVLADGLCRLGYRVYVGEEIVNPQVMMGRPDSSAQEEYRRRMADTYPEYRDLMARMGCATGVVAVLDTGRPGPVSAYRFDIDALPIRESRSDNHLPNREGFASCVPGVMHACGHDGHTAVGMVLAHRLVEDKERLSGRFLLLFQPAEEGARGGKALADSWKFEVPDYLYGFHIGFADEGELVCGVDRFLVTTKFDVEFRGESAHAGTTPNQCKNALLAAAEASVCFQDIPARPEGITRLNVGILKAGEARNAIAAHARIQAETRGETEELDAYMMERSSRILDEVSRKYQVDCERRLMGKTASVGSHEILSWQIQCTAEELGIFRKVTLHKRFPASEDVTWLMRMVHQNGGQAAYLLFGTRLPEGHHKAGFDYPETVLDNALELLYQTALKNHSL